MTERLHFHFTFIHFSFTFIHFSLLCIGEGSGNPLQCSCLENPRDGVAQSRTCDLAVAAVQIEICCRYIIGTGFQT